MFAEQKLGLSTVSVSKMPTVGFVFHLSFLGKLAYMCLVARHAEVASIPIPLIKCHSHISSFVFVS